MYVPLVQGSSTFVFSLFSLQRKCNLPRYLYIYKNGTASTVWCSLTPKPVHRLPSNSHTAYNSIRRVHLRIFKTRATPPKPPKHLKTSACNSSHTSHAPQLHFRAARDEGCLLSHSRPSTVIQTTPIDHRPPIHEHTQLLRLASR
jgi:hypothetical protein